MNTNPPTTGAEEGTISAPLEKLPKLNLPPKPVLATATNTATPPPSPTPAATPVTKPISEPPPIAKPPAPSQVTTPTKKIETAETSATNKKRPTLSIPLAMIAFVVALLGLIVQLFAFLHLF